MKFIDIVVMTLRNLFRRKTRTILTITGVVVGTCSIVLMISLGVALNMAQEKMLESFGDLTVIEVYNWGGGPDSAKLDDETVALINQHPNVTVASPMWRPGIQMAMFAGKKDRYKMQWMNIYGVYPDALQAFGYELKEGAYLNETNGEFDIIMGEFALYEFIDTKKRGDRQYNWVEMDENGNIINEPFVTSRDEFKLTLIHESDQQNFWENKKLSSKSVSLSPKLTGIIKAGTSRGGEGSHGIFMRISDLQKLVKQYNKINDIKESKDSKVTYDNIKVKASSIDTVEEVDKYIKSLGFEDTWSLNTMRESMQEQSRQIQMVLGGLGAISLFVAAIGITNTMVMSIYERTREIGVMKVLGCFIADIRTEFLMEAGLIGFFGGVAGIVISFAISAILNYLSSGGGGGFLGGIIEMYGGGGDPISVIPLWLVGLALLFGTLVGLVAGFGPANRAVKISAMEAIKHD